MGGEQEAEVTFLSPTLPGREPFKRLLDKWLARQTVPVVVMTDTRRGLAESLLAMLAEVTTKYAAVVCDDTWYSREYARATLGALKFSGRRMIGYDPSVEYDLVNSMRRGVPHFGLSCLHTMLGEAEAMRVYFRQAAVSLPLARDAELARRAWAVARVRGEGVTTVGNFAATFKYKNPDPPAEGWNPDKDGSWLRQLLKEDADEYGKLAAGLRFD